MESKQNITVFGATGKIGMELLKLLSNAQVPVIAVTRDMNKATAMPLVEWIQGDMDDKSSLYKTMKNTKAVFLLSTVNDKFIQGQSNVVDVAKSEGVAHIVKLSSGAADKDSPLFIPKAHGEVEAYIQQSGMAWTMLRPNGLMQNWLRDHAQTVSAERKIYEATGDGRRAYIDMRDIAEVAYNVLMTPEKHAGKTYLLTGGEAVNYRQIAEYISNAIGMHVSFVPVTADEVKKDMERSGIPQWAIYTFLAYDELQFNGKTEFVSSAVQDILHKPARTVAAFIKDYAYMFK